MPQALEQKFPCSPLERSVVRQAVLLQLLELCGGAEIYVQSVEDPMLKQVDMPRRRVQHVEKACRSRFSGRSCSSEFMLEQTVPEGLFPMGRSLIGTVHGGL